MSDFESYCSRMWLDYCDENNTFHSECLPKDEYTEKYHDWLLKNWKKDPTAKRNPEDENNRISTRVSS